VSKFEPSVGDVAVVGVITCLNRNALSSAAFFVADITANGYDSVAQNLFVPMLGYCCASIPDGIENGDAVTADILQGDYALYAGNITKL
jgi:hypothetical protein